MTLIVSHTKKPSYMSDIRIRILCTLTVVILVVMNLDLLFNMKKGNLAEQYNVTTPHGKNRYREAVYSKLNEKFVDHTMYVGVLEVDDSNREVVDKVISCYYNAPTNFSDPQELMPNDIHPHLCTHINIAFATIVNKTIWLSDNIKVAIKNIVNLKKNNPMLKILLSIGGAGENNGFSDMVIDHASRKLFIKSIKAFLEEYKCDGIDLDWEFPAVHDTLAFQKHSRERQHFSQLLREIRVEYQREKRDYLLTVAVAAPQVIVDFAYDVDQLNLYTDYVNLMTYDFHFYAPDTPFTGLNSPLYPRSDDISYLATLNINSTVSMYIIKGLRADKIVVGIPTYGHTFTLRNSRNPLIGSPASGYGSLGSHGFVNYPDICKFMQEYNNQVTIETDENAKVPYLHRSHEWVSYEDQRSVMEKAEYIKSYGLRGAMIYSLNADDYLGSCQLNDNKFPLSHSVRSTLLEEDIDSQIYIID